MEGQLRQLQPRIEQFIYSYIDSLEQLEVLLLLFQSPQRSWSVSDVYDAIKSNRASISRRLENLVQLGLVVATEDAQSCFRFQVSNPEIAQTIQELSDAYTQRRLPGHRSNFFKTILVDSKFRGCFPAQKGGQERRTRWLNSFTFYAR